MQKKQIKKEKELDRVTKNTQNNKTNKYGQ